MTNVLSILLEKAIVYLIKGAARKVKSVEGQTERGGGIKKKEEESQIKNDLRPERSMTTETTTGKPIQR